MDPNFMGPRSSNMLRAPRLHSTTIAIKNSIPKDAPGEEIEEMR